MLCLVIFPSSQTLLLLPHSQFGFSRISCHWNHAVCGGFLIGLCQSKKFIQASSLHFHGVIVHLALIRIPFLGFHCHYLFAETEGHFGCFQDLAIMNKTAMSKPVQVFGWHYFSIYLGIYQKYGFKELYALCLWSATISCISCDGLNIISKVENKITITHQILHMNYLNINLKDVTCEIPLHKNR